MQNYDAIIIGAGVIGAAISLELARKGWKTLNVDMLPAAGYGSTSASCAIIRTHYSTLAGSAIAYEGYFYWKNWAQWLATDDERGLAEFRETGCAVMKTQDNGYLAKIMANMDALSIPCEDWDAAMLKARMGHYDTSLFAPAKRPEMPGFGEPDADSKGHLAGAVYFPCAGYITDPQLSAHNEQRATEAAGGKFLFNRRVVEIAKSGDGSVSGVRLDDGTQIASPVVVNVGGPHSSKINEMAGAATDMKISTRALKQEVVHVPSPVEGYDNEGMVTSDSDIACYTRPEKGNFILVGSEDPPCDPREWVDPDNFDENFSEQWRIQALRCAQRIPELGIPSAMKGVVSLYDVSEDWIPIYDSSSVPGYYMAIGSSGNQFKNAPIAGAMMAHLIEQVQAGHDHDAEPLHFTGPYTGCDIDIGFYSRNREINRESSFSVLG
jgi:sarcosine oxidase subunit beta